MEIPKLDRKHTKPHWSHADGFYNQTDKQIRCLVHKEYTIGFHTHSFYELNIVLRGEGYHYIEEMSCPARAGCVFLIPPHVNHGYINKKHLDVYHMLIHRDFFENQLEDLKQTEGFALLFETEPYIRMHYDENVFLILTKEEQEAITQDLWLIASCDKLNHSEVYINAIAKKVICQLCILIAKRHGIAQVSLKTGRELRSIADCLNYIHQNYDEKLTVEHLAGISNMSRSTFIRHFTKICGCSPYQYIQQYRLKRAKEYLRTGEYSLTQVALQCGFYDASHLRKYLQEDPSSVDP